MALHKSFTPSPVTAEIRAISPSATASALLMLSLSARSIWKKLQLLFIVRETVFNNQFQFVNLHQGKNLENDLHIICSLQQ